MTQINQRITQKEWQDQKGQAVTEYVLLLALMALAVVGALTLMGGSVRDALGQLVGDEEVGEGSGKITVTVTAENGQGIPDVPVFVYDENGIYQKVTGKTDQTGTVSFDLPDGRYRFLSQHQLQWFWSDTVLLVGEAQATVDTGARPFTVQVNDITGKPVADVALYAYTEAEEYIGVEGTTAVDGTAVFSLVDNTLAFRADYNGKSYWSDAVAVSEDTVTITINPCGTGEFLAEYFNNRNLSGEPVLTRCEQSIDYNWARNSPGNGVNKDNFSIRWTGDFQFEEKKYAFTTTSDDGVRVWVDDALLVDAWKPQSATTYRAPQRLTAGVHTVKMEYYERGGYAVAKLGWSEMVESCPTGQFLAEYFNNRNLSGEPAVVRCENAIQNNWGSGVPVQGVNKDNFSVRWSGRFPFEDATYTFRASADDGIRMWVDGSQVFNGWRNQTETAYAGRKELTAGEHELRVEYYDAGSVALAKVSWEKAVTECAPGQFLAEYFNNRNLSGDPVYSQCESSINYQWKTGGPGSGVGPDNFSVRWEGQFNFEDEEYKFKATADDGVQVFVDGTAVINAWRNQSATKYEREVDMSAGMHTVRVNYYENGGYATIIVGWKK
jgi:Flp pilus assembly pilin Flp